MAPQRDAGEDPAPVRVFLVDDHEVVRQGVRDVLELSGGIVVVGEERSAALAADRILQAQPDVAVVDLRLEDGSGIEVCREVASGARGIATVVLTAHDDEEALVAAVLAGAAGYVLKLVRGSSLVQTVREVGAGRRTIGADQVERVLAGLERRQADVRESERLTTQEGQVLSLIGSGHTDRGIATELHLPDDAVRGLVSSLLVKTGMASPQRESGTGHGPGHGP